MGKPRFRMPSVQELLGALMVAFGTLFQTKARPDDHWSTRPGIELITEFEADEAAGSGRRARRRRAAV